MFGKSDSEWRITKKVSFGTAEKDYFSLHLPEWMTSTEVYSLLPADYWDYLLYNPTYGSYLSTTRAETIETHPDKYHLVSLSELESRRAKLQMNLERADQAITDLHHRRCHERQWSQIAAAQEDDFED